MNSWVGSDGVLHEGKCLGSKDEFQVIDCEACGFKHVIPIPTEDFLKTYYQDHWVENRPAEFYEKVESDFEWQKKFYDEKYDVFDRHCQGDKKRILDIGSGLGLFLKVGKERGWETLGIEPSVESYDYAKRHGVGLENAFFNEENYSSFGTFDVVHMHEVIEHIRDPMAMIRMAREILNPGGILCIVSPNEFNPLQNAYVASSGLAKWWISPPEHINYFDFDSITNALGTNGLDVVELTSTFPLELFLLMGDEYIGNDKIGKEIHQKRVNLETNLSGSANENLRRDLYKKFGELGLGREFVVFAKKN